MRGRGASEPSESVLTTRAMLAALIKTWPRRVALSLVLLMPLVLALSGGLNAAAPREVEVIDQGAPVDAGVYTIRVDYFFVAEQAHRMELPEGAGAWLGVVMEGVNPNAEAVRFNRQVFTLPEGLVVGAETDSNPTPEHVRRLDDGSNDDRFPPALPTSMVALWPVADAEDVPQELEVTFRSLVREWSEVLGGYSWYEGGLLGHQVIPRDDDRLPAILVEEGE